jgi:hypothetical protein
MRQAAVARIDGLQDPAIQTIPSSTTHESSPAPSARTPERASCSGRSEAPIPEERHRQEDRLQNAGNGKNFFRQRHEAAYEHHGEKAEDGQRNNRRTHARRGPASSGDHRGDRDHRRQHQHPRELDDASRRQGDGAQRLSGRHDLADVMDAGSNPVAELQVIESEKSRQQLELTDPPAAQRV